MTTQLTFLGAAAAVPGAGEDTASFLVNGTLLFDCGWYAALKMQQYGYSPLNVETLFFTHCHHDHYMGLPALLFFRGMRQSTTAKVLPPLTIVGPPDDLPIVVEKSRQFLQVERFPNIWPQLQLHPLEPGHPYETDAFRIDTIRALHPVTGVCGRLLIKDSGTVIAFSGDTAPNAELVELARDADLLIHEASLPSDAPNDGAWGHSRAIDAAHTAREAGVKQLRLVHLGGHREASIEAARAIFPESALATEGETLLF